jgi:putative spermidine/putrescine transport system ATP-binding protein
MSVLDRVGKSVIISQASGAGASPRDGGLTAVKAAGKGGAAIELKGLNKHYGGLAVLADASLNVAESEFVSLLGPSGSGKTTTLMIIAGFVAPSAGSVLLEGEDITRLPPYRRNIGMVYQNYALFPHMTVERNVAFPLRMRGVPRAEIERRVQHALVLVRLEGLGRRMPSQLSGGQQQRVALARALVFEPPLLLMDEPLGALDKKLREELQIEIKRIQRETRSTVIYVTHDQEEALSMSDRVVVMNRGRIEQVGPPSELYERPQTRFVADFLGTSNFLAVTVDQASEPLTVRTPGGLRLSVPSAPGVRTGESLTLSIRPERIRLEAEAAAGPGTARGAIAECAYYGNAQRYHVRLESGDNLIVLRPNTGLPILAVGTPVTVSWSPADVWVLPERPGEIP